MSGFHTSMRPDGIFVWTYKDFKRDTTDEWIHMLRRLMYEYDAKNEHLRCLAFFAESALPTPYATTKGISILKEYPPTLAFSVALISDNSLVFSVMRYAMQQARSIDFFKFCKSEQEALIWLGERQTLFEANGQRRLSL